MVRFFSVDWLAQSHCSRPHVPCMVQPRAPAFGKGYLQPKPKAAKAALQADPEASGLGPQLCASPISELSEDSSGYESEAASSDCTSVDEGGEAEQHAPQRRVRTKFTPDQIRRLEKIFSKQKYLDAAERVKTARRLKLTETQEMLEKQVMGRFLLRVQEAGHHQTTLVLFTARGCGGGSFTISA